MPKKSVRAEISSFVKGLITEANPLNFPADASLDEVNFVLNKDGSRDRRLGMDLEDDYLAHTLGVAANDLALRTFRWDTVGGESGFDILVVQAGTRLVFFDLAADNLSRDGKLGELVIPLPLSFTTKFNFASVKGFLVVITGGEDIVIIDYASGAFNLSTARVEIRDTFGVQAIVNGKDLTDDRYIGTRIPFVDSTDSHRYNLRNQSWGLPRRGPGFSVVVDPLEVFRLYSGDYQPSNTDVVFNGLHFSAASGTPVEELIPRLIDETRDGRIAAPKGYFVIDAIRRGTGRLNAFLNNNIENGQLTYGISTLPQDYSPGGFTDVVEYAGRIWYVGDFGEVVDGDNKSPDLSSFLFFSQLVKNKSDINKCYQEGDPASREGSDIVDTDGGFLPISGMKGKKALYVLNESLVILADNGVWILKGGSNSGFTATNYEVEKVSSYGCVSRDSICIDGASLYYWSDDGIYVVSKNEFGDYTYQNMTDKTIKRFYDDINTSSKEKSQGMYDPFERKIRWLYREDKTKELVFDPTLGAFNPNTIEDLATNTPLVKAFFESNPYQLTVVSTVVTVEGAAVTVAAENVTTDQDIANATVKSIKYLVTIPSGANTVFTFASYKNPNFLDWELADGVGIDAAAYIETGSVTAGDTSVHKQVPYLVMHFRRTETGFQSILGDIVPVGASSCLVRSMWDFANSANSNKWSRQFQAYRYRRFYMPEDVFDDYDTGFAVITTRNKIRGRGRAFSLRMETEAGKDCKILGWSLSINGNQNV